MTVRIGVVGAGALGFHHTRILRDVPGAQLMGFHEADPARAEKVSSELGVKAFASLDALLDVVDAVSVSFPRRRTTPSRRRRSSADCMC